MIFLFDTQQQATQEKQATTPFFLTDKGLEVMIGGSGAILGLGLLAIIIHKATQFVIAVKASK